MTNFVTTTVNEVLISLKNLAGRPLSPALQNQFDDALESLTDALERGQKLNTQVKVAHMGTGNEQAIDPTTNLMTKIAKALSSAEDELNTQNLVITNALVEMNMKIDGGSGASADTLVKFGIEPQSTP